MGLFDRNPNEAAFVHGKKHWTDVIKNSGPAEALIWRQPEEDFNTRSTLIVFPSEEAIFFKGGAVEQIFSEGTYQLATENYPFVSRLRNAFSGGISTFNCVVYFVRKSQSMEVRWGTDSPIQVRDPVLNIATSVQARGAYRIQIADAVRFLNRLLGHGAKSFTQEDLSQFFRNEFQQLIKSSITGEIRKSKEEILGICARQTDLAEQIAPLLASPLAEIGLELLSFSIGSIDIPKTDPNRQMLEESFARRGVRVQEAHAKREEQEILEIAWAQRESAEILRDVANNPGAGGIAAAGAGLGVGVAAGSVFGTMAQQMFAPLQPGQAAPAGPAAASAGRFVQKSAAREDAEPPVSPDDPVIKIKQLKSMLDIGAISQEEYDSKKKEILDRL